MSSKVAGMCSQLAQQSQLAETAYQNRELDKALTMYGAAAFTNFGIANHNKVGEAMTWRYKGLTNAAEREACYQEAARLVREVLDDTEPLRSKPELVETRARARHTLMLLPDEDVESLFVLAEAEVEGSALSQTEKNAVLSKLWNARALPQRRPDPDLAIEWFEKAAELAPYGSADFGNPNQNASDCCKNKLNAAETPEDVEKHFQSGLTYLHRALDAYPLAEKGHRDSTLGKIGQLEKARQDKLDQLNKK